MSSDNGVPKPGVEDGVAASKVGVAEGGPNAGVNDKKMMWLGVW